MRKVIGALEHQLRAGRRYSQKAIAISVSYNSSTKRIAAERAALSARFNEEMRALDVAGNIAWEQYLGETNAARTEYERAIGVTSSSP